MKVLTVYAHQSPRSFCHGVLEHLKPIRFCNFPAILKAGSTAYGPWTSPSG